MAMIWALRVFLVLNEISQLTLSSNHVNHGFFLIEITNHSLHAQTKITDGVTAVGRDFGIETSDM